MTNETSGNYTLDITLEDSMAKSSSYEVIFEILPHFEDSSSEDVSEYQDQILEILYQ